MKLADDDDQAPGSGLRTALSLLLSHPLPLLCLIPLLLALRFLRNRYLSPLRHHPGPFLASGTRLWKLYITWTTHQETAFVNLHKKYGPVVRTSPHALSFSSPPAARTILSAGKGFHKTPFYSVFPPAAHPDIFTETREAVHAAKKRVAAPLYSLPTLSATAAAPIDSTIALLGERLDGLVGEPEVDLGAWLHFFAFDVLGVVAFGRRWGFLEQGRDVEGCIGAIDASQRYNGVVGQVPGADRWLRGSWGWGVWQRWGRGAVPLVTRIAEEEVGRRRRRRGGEKVGGKDLLGGLLEASERVGEGRFGVGDVFAVAHGAIFAGSDSTASTMQSFFYYVLRDRNVYRKLVAEVDEAAKTGRLSRVVQFGEAQQLPYFQAALKEAMRIRPAVGLAMARSVPPEGAEIDGVRYPGGTELNVNPWAVHRDRGMFGEDAEEYRPERWLEDEERARLMDRHMIHFGGGSHLCIGRNLALLEMNKVLPMLLRDYALELVHPDRDLEFHTYFFVVQKGLDVRISKRV